jgi:hypothetical protein
MEKRTKAIRVEIDALATLTGTLDSSREIGLAKTSFENSKMMLGKVLQTIGTPNPYPNSKDPKSPVIEPTADVAGDLPYIDDFDHVGKVKAIRQFADQVCTKLENEIITFNMTRPSPSKWKTTLFLQESWMECQKGMMWLGMELSRVHNLYGETPTNPDIINVEKLEGEPKAHGVFGKIMDKFKRD